MESDEGEFDLGFGSNKKNNKVKGSDNEGELAGLGSDEEMGEGEQMKAIEE